MKKLLFLVCALSLSLSSYAQTADEIVQRHIKAIGGIDKLKAVQSVRATGKMKMGPMEAPMTNTKARPNKTRMEFTIQGMTGTQAFDGTTGWNVMPFMGKKDAVKAEGDALNDLQEEADFDGPLVGYQAKGNKIELAGKENVNGAPAYKLKVTLKNGNVLYQFIDAATYLLVKTNATRTVQGQQIESETVIGNYKDVGNGVMMAYSFESHAVGQAGTGQSVVFDKYEINPKLDVAVFTMPGAGR